jgi:hypothetical protein
MLPSDSIPIPEVLGVTLKGVYYHPTSNQFYTKRRGITSSFWPVMWKHVVVSRWPLYPPIFSPWNLPPNLHVSDPADYPNYPSIDQNDKTD